MNNSTPANVYQQGTFRKLPKFIFLLVIMTNSLFSWAQSTPQQVTDALQQFTTNLLSVTGSGNVPVDGNIAVLDIGFSNGIDGFDVLKTSNTAENFALLRDNQSLLIEYRQPVISRDTLFYKMSNLKQQQYQLQFYAINMNKPGLSAFLVDRFLNTNTPLSLSTTPVTYSFTVNADAGSFAEDRFIVVLTQIDAGPLPVNFISISATQRAGGTLVNWKVGGESGIKNYLVERSTNGKNFNVIGTVAATGFNSNDIIYSFTDGTSANGTYFYRVKSNDLSGEIKISSIVKISIGSSRSAIIVSPNPVEDNSIHLQLINQPKGKYELRLMNTNGAQLFKTTIINADGNSVQTIKAPSTLAKGIYQLEIINTNGIKQIQSLLLK